MKTKSLILVMMGLISQQIWAGNLSNGDFKGHGLFRSLTADGSYEVSTTIHGSSVATRYILPDGSQKEWKFDMVTSTKNFFNVVIYGVEVGKGYCLEEVELCHYEISVSNLKLEETIATLNGKLYRYGSKDEGSGRIMYQESLERQ